MLSELVDGHVLHQHFFISTVIALQLIHAIKTLENRNQYRNGGKNTLTIKYRQGMYVDGRTAYIGGPVFVCGFEYLLYPAFTWKMNPDFELFISVALPDFQKKGWLWDSRIAPITESNITFHKTYNPETRRTTYETRSKSIPAPVLAFIVRRDQKE